MPIVLKRSLMGTLRTEKLLKNGSLIEGTFTVNTKNVVTICDGIGCLERGSGKIKKALQREIKEKGLEDQVSVKLSGCLGMCEKGPMMVVNPGYTIYGYVTEADVTEIVDEHLIGKKPISRLAVKEDHLY